ncbi:hypothetical protein FHL15_009289 [Xylaria flabelliformis]|uniref:Uncharacterized protein n=1 Tax=Xylaria flabelliformis TaxID=2512241 RepID=A0A553HPH6_9PEZI|nr:hypothetical protein FHL15_009289 [Xylaria flabelliformis]
MEQGCSILFKDNFQGWSTANNTTSAGLSILGGAYDDNHGVYVPLLDFAAERQIPWSNDVAALDSSDIKTEYPNIYGAKANTSGEKLSFPSAEDTMKVYFNIGPSGIFFGGHDGFTIRSLVREIKPQLSISRDMRSHGRPSLTLPHQSSKMCTFGIQCSEPGGENVK